MNQKRSLLFTILFLTIVLVGCQTNGDEVVVHSSGNKVTDEKMPEIMPNDFNFSVSFGVGKKNEINTFNGTVTKDLITDGTKTISLMFSKEEMQAIYEKMKEIKINEPKEFIPKKGCSKEPFEEDEWTIQIKGKTFTLSISWEYCDQTEDATKLLNVRNYIFNIVKSKDAYKSLPNPSGGYE